MHDVDERERSLMAILKRLDADLTPPERAEVELFIEAREYGLALEALRDIFVEEAKMMSAATFADFHDLAERMGIREVIVTDDLRRQVS